MQMVHVAGALLHRKHSVGPWGNCKLFRALDHLEVPVPMSMAAAPAPPDALAGPFGYTAMSDATCEHEMGLGAEPLTVRMRTHRRIWGWCMLLQLLGILPQGGAPRWPGGRPRHATPSS